MLVNPEVSKVLRATNKAAATLSADSDDTCTRRWTASCPDGELLASLASSHGHGLGCFLLACLASLASLTVCLRAFLLHSRLGRGGSWQLCCTFFIQGFALCNLLLLAARLLSHLCRSAFFSFAAQQGSCRSLRSCSEFRWKVRERQARFRRRLQCAMVRTCASSLSHQS